MSVRNADEVARLEKKIDAGIASVRRESREDFRFLFRAIAAVLVLMLLGVVGIALRLS